jgi:hypothetical protein
VVCRRRRVGTRRLLARDEPDWFAHVLDVSTVLDARTGAQLDGARIHNSAAAAAAPTTPDGVAGLTPTEAERAHPPLLPPPSAQTALDAARRSAGRSMAELLRQAGHGPSWPTPVARGRAAGSAPSGPAPGSGFSRPRSTIACSGGLRSRPTTSRTFASNSGPEELERAGAATAPRPISGPGTRRSALSSWPIPRSGRAMNQRACAAAP